jgi:nucleotide-binding universal stress UspA family protein
MSSHEGIKNVLLVVPPDMAPHRACGEAIAAAKRLGGALIAVIVLDPNEPGRVASSLDSAFVGEKVSDQIAELLAREQRSRAEEVLEEIKRQAESSQVAFEGLIEEGDPTDVCSRIIRSRGVAEALLVAEKRSWLTRFLSRSAAVRLPHLSGCVVRVMEEDGADD